jgi:hypothetical protein
VDVNQVLPTGQPNPNYGRPFANIYSQANWLNNFSERETMRATGFMKYDFKDTKSSWGRWLGRHTLTGLYEESKNDSIAYTHRFAADGDAARDINGNINIFARRPGVLVYLGPSLIGNSNPLQLSPIQIPAIQAGPLSVPVRYFVRPADATTPGAFVDAPASLVEINGGGNAERDLIKSRAALLQSYWLRDHLVTLVGWRRDADYFARQNINFVANPANLNDPGKVHYGFNDLTLPGTPPLNVTADTWTYSGVLRWPKQIIKLPAGTDFSISYNESANFTPSGGRVDGFNQPLASPSGKTREYGFSLSAFHDKLSLRVSRFQTDVQGQSFTPGVYNTTINNAILQAADIWGVEANVNPQLAASRNADIALLFSPLPANFRQLYGWGIVGTAPNLAAAGRLTGLSGAGDTTDFTAKGTEIEIVYNPTRNWRILMNVARQESIQTNSLPFLKKLIGLMTPVWDQLRDRPAPRLSGRLPAHRSAARPGPTYLRRLPRRQCARARLPPRSPPRAPPRPSSANGARILSPTTPSAPTPLSAEKLKGLGFGGAVRWQDRLGIGYPTTRNTNLSVTLDLAHPFYAPAETNYDAWLSYERKVWQNRINWKVQLNARNLFGSKEPIAIGAQPWGAPSTVRLAPERRWYLTNTFSF